MKVVRYEGVSYVAVESEEDKKCLEVIKKALYEQSGALESEVEEAVTAVVEDVLDLSSQPHGVICDIEDYNDLGY